MSLSDCIKQFGKAFNKSDADDLMFKRDELIAKGVDEAEAESLALRDLEESAIGDLNEILEQVGIKPKDLEKGVDIEIDGQVVDSNRYLADIDGELQGLDDITRCLYR